MTAEPVPGVVVRVRFMTRRQLKQAWVRDLAHNTLFVRTDLPLPVGSHIRLALELPDAVIIEVDGEVAHIVTLEAATPTRPAGMAVHMSDFEGPKRGRIEEYLRRSRTLVPGQATQKLRAITDAAPQVPLPAMETLVRSVRRLVWLCGDAAGLREVDHYQVLGLSPTARTEEIREACTILRVLLEPSSPPEGLADRLTEVQRARIGALHALILEIERTLTDPQRRAAYDAEVFSIVR